MTAASSSRSRIQWLGIYVRGVAMGIAEVVPGVSGGTIAFISGIYDELIHALASFRPSSLKMLTTPGEFFRHHNLGFLLALGFGMVTGVALFAHLLSLALEHARPVVWGFFLGVICLSVYLLGRERPLRMLAICFPPGFIFGLLVVSLDPGSGDAAVWLYFFGGAIAVAAWLLPAVSGSFLLLVLGLYEGVLGALVALDLAILVALLGGCLVGLLTFANLLSWLMRNYREPLLSILTGFLAGSLVRLWPWTGSAGELLLPDGYQSLLSLDPLSGWVLLAFFAGMLGIWLLGRLGR